MEGIMKTVSKSFKLRELTPGMTSPLLSGQVMEENPGSRLKRVMTTPIISEAQEQKDTKIRASGRPPKHIPHICFSIDICNRETPVPMRG